MEKAISINIASHEELIGDSNSAWFFEIDCLFENSLAILWFAKFPISGTEIDEIMISGDKFTAKHWSEIHDAI